MAAASHHLSKVEVLCDELDNLAGHTSDQQVAAMTEFLGEITLVRKIIRSRKADETEETELVQEG